MKKTKPLTLTDTQRQDLHRLAKAVKAAADAADIRKRFKAFIDDNEAALRQGVKIDDLLLSVKVTKQLSAEEVND